MSFSKIIIATKTSGRNVGKIDCLIKVRIQFEMYWFWPHFFHIFSSNDNLLKTQDSILQKKINKLQNECKPKQDPEKVILNFPVFFTEAKKLLLAKGLSF